MIGYVIKGEIISKKYRVQLKISSLKNVKEIDQNKIKTFLREVDLDLEYYTNLPLLHQASLEYHRVMGNELTFNKENAQQWIQSTEFIELTYALRWIYEMSSYKDREELNIVFDPKDQILKKIILLNIGLEQKKEISQINLNQIVCDNTEILYGLSLYIQKRIETLDLSTYVPLLQNMMLECDKSAINQLIVIELIDKVLQKFSGFQDEQVRKLKLTSNITSQIKWEEDYIQYTLLEQENPNFQLRKTKQVYLYTKEQYEVKMNIFKSQWEDQFPEIFTQNELQIQLQKSSTFQLSDVFSSNLNAEEEIQTSVSKKRYQILNQTFKLAQSQPNLQIQSQTRVNLPPPLPLPKVKSTHIPNSIYVKFNYPVLQNQLDGTIWKANMIDYETSIDQDILRYFEKKEQNQTKMVPDKIFILKNEVEYGNSVFKNQTEIELKRKRFEKTNLDEILDQVNKLEFLEKNQDKNMRAYIQLLNSSIQFISDDNVKKIEQNIKKFKQDNNEYRKRKSEEEDQQQKQERERLKKLQKEEREKELFSLDVHLNYLQKDLEAILTENDLSEFEPKLEKLRNALSIVDKEDEKNTIFSQFESFLFLKQKFLQYKRLENQEKYQIPLNDSFLKYLYDKNPRKGIQIEAFYDEHLDHKIHIMDIVTQFSEIFEELSKDVELILYFKYIQQFGKVFNNFQAEQFGLKFENVIKFTYKTQQLKGEQIELTKYIVDLMAKQGIPFKDLKDTPFKYLPQLSKQNNALSEVKKIIQLYSDHLDFLKVNLQALSFDENNLDFIKKATQYSVEYTEFIFQMQTIYEKDLQNLNKIRHFFCDDRTNVESPKFFEDILAIKSLLRIYHTNIIQEEKKKLLLQAQNRKVGE